MKLVFKVPVAVMVYNKIPSDYQTGKPDNTMRGQTTTPSPPANTK
jgi:hypothetical protein